MAIRSRTQGPSRAPRRPRGAAGDFPRREEVKGADESAPPAASQAPPSPATSDAAQYALSRTLLGFDPQEAVERLGGDLDFYRALLARFVGDVPVLLADLADRSDTTLAHWSAACHSLKGTAATLGLTALADASADVERAFKQLGDTSTQTMDVSLFDRIERLSGLVSQACDAAQQWLDMGPAPEKWMESSVSAVANAPAGQGVDFSALVPALQSLIACLEESDLQALALYERLAVWREPATEALWLALENAMHNLDFEKAVLPAAKLLKNAQERQAQQAL